MQYECLKATTSLVPRPSYGRNREGAKGRTSLSPRTNSCRANQIGERCHMTNGMLIIRLCMLRATERVRMR